MVSCGQYKMMPMAPTSVMAISPSSKPKIGFSIDSIVGNNSLHRQLHQHHQDCNSSPRSESPDRPSSSLSDYNYPLELRNNDVPRNFRLDENSINHVNIRTNKLQQLMSMNFQKNFNNLTESTSNCHDVETIQKSNENNNCSPTPLQQSLSPDDSSRNLTRTPSPTSQPSSHHQSLSNRPIVVPGIPAGLIRPFPVQPSNIGDMKQLPSYLNPPDVTGTPNHHHFLAAQFQMAAAIAHGQASGQGFPPGAGLPQHHTQFSNPNMVRESYPLYPWLLNRHGRIFPHRFPGSE